MLPNEYEYKTKTQILYCIDYFILRTKKNNLKFKKEKISQEN